MAAKVVPTVGVEYGPQGYTASGRGYGSDNKYEIFFATLVSFLPYDNGFVRDDANIKIVETEFSQWDVTVPYKLAQGKEPEVGEWSFEFNYTMPGIHIYQSLETVWSSTGAPDFGGAINVTSDDGKQKVEGLDLNAPPETFKVRYARAAKYFNDDYRETVGAMVGTYNNATFKNHAAGELLLVSVSGGIGTGQKANIVFGFSYIPNKTTSFSAGGITVPSKKGHDLLWLHYGDEVDTSAYALIKEPKAAYVERVYETSNFAALGF